MGLSGRYPYCVRPVKGEFPTAKMKTRVDPNEVAEEIVTPLSVFDVATEAKDALASFADPKGIETRVDVQAESKHLFVDNTHGVIYLLRRLLANAVENTPSGTVSMQLSIEDGLDNDINARFEITDNGDGSAAAATGDRANRFDLDDILLRIERLGGQSGVLYDPAEGTTFWFSVPARLRSSER